MLALSIATAASAFAQSDLPAQVADTSKGKTLVDPNGMTLYTFDKDVGGKSACTGGCAANWPALTAPAGANPAGDWTIVARDEGKMQWAYKGKPLYTFVKDAKPGDVTGDGFLNNSWHVAAP